jgi:hypothetical protein
MTDKSKILFSTEEFTNFNTDRHKNAKPPRDAYLYLPRDFEKIDHNETDPTNSMRKIFDLPLEDYTPFEKDSIVNFHIELDRYNNTAKVDDVVMLPPDWKQCETLRFLQATHFKIIESIKLIHKHLTWRLAYFPITLTNNAMEILNSGFIYGHGRDYRYRPIFVVRSEIYLKLAKKYSYDDWLMAVVYFCEYIVKQMTIPGQLENWIIIADVSNTSILQIPSDVNKLFQMLQSHYRCRLITIYIYGMSNVLNFIWNIIKNMLHPSTNKKIRFLKQDKLSELFESIHPDQVEKRYGGHAENLEMDYFPPYMPGGSVLLSGEVVENLLITDDRYRELFITGKITTMSPYILLNDTRSIYTNPYTHLSGQRGLTSNKNYSKVNYNL